METNKTLNWPKLQIGISSCLIGNRVRHNGEHKANEWLLTQLAPFVSWVAICPELEMGLGVPRETMRLVGIATRPRLITFNSKEDQTEKAEQTIDRILKKDFKLDGFIFKKDSPTCGLERVKVYGPSGIPVKNGMGLFAKAVQEKFPKIPMIEEGRLSDPNQREFFLNQLYIFSQFTRIHKSTRALQEFHQNHKLQLMAYDPGKYQFLGQLAANSTKQEITEVFTKYEELLSNLIKKPLTRKKYINVFQHMLGYFKEDLDAKEKAHLLKLLEGYRKAKIPLISVSIVFNYLVAKHSVQYLEKQSILNPYPEEILTGDQI
jgi:uncharacterized protein YbgA (DUF1722 family)/uncharacterized protein YbbK (DUF523 family)